MTATYKTTPTQTEPFSSSPSYSNPSSSSLELKFRTPENAAYYVKALVSLLWGSDFRISATLKSGKTSEALSLHEIFVRLERDFFAALRFTLPPESGGLSLDVSLLSLQSSGVLLRLPVRDVPSAHRIWCQCDPGSLTPLLSLALDFSGRAFVLSALHGFVGLSIRCGGLALAHLQGSFDLRWFPEKPRADALPFYSHFSGALWNAEQEQNRSPEFWVLGTSMPIQRKLPDDAWWAQFDQLTASPHSSLPDLQSHLSSVFQIPFHWEICDLREVTSPSFAVPPEVGASAYLLPKKGKVSFAIDMSLPGSSFGELLLHLCSHGELGHVRPEDPWGHWDTLASATSQTPHRRWDHEARSLLASVCRRPSRQVTSLEGCTPTEKAQLGLWRIIGEILGEKGQLHPAAEAYQKAAYQRQAAQRLLAMLEEFGGAMLCDGVGLGKTYVATTLLVHYVNSWRDGHTSSPSSPLQDPFRITILAPNSVVSTWQREALPPLIPLGVLPATTRVLSHTKLSRISPSSEILTPSQDSPSSLEHLLLSDLVIVDEAHNFRSLAARRTKVLRDLLRLQPRRDLRRRVVLLTATPLNNSLDDLRQEVSLLFSRSVFLSKAETRDEYRKLAVKEIQDRCQKARQLYENAAELVALGRTDAKFSDTIDFRDDLRFDPTIQRLGDYLKEQDKLLKDLQTSTRTDAQSQAPLPSDRPPLRIAEALLDRIVVQRSRSLCKEIERHQPSNSELLFRPDSSAPEQISYSDEYDGFNDVLARFLPLFEAGDEPPHPPASPPATKPLSLRIYMWQEICENPLYLERTSPVIGLQRVLVLKRLESSPVSFLITLLRLAVLHAHRLEQLKKRCFRVQDHLKLRELEIEIQDILARHSQAELKKIHTLATNEPSFSLPLFFGRLSLAYTKDRPAADTDDPPPQLSLPFEEEEQDTAQKEQLDRLWNFRAEILSDFATLLRVLPGLTDTIFGKFAQAEWPRQFIAGGNDVKWPEKPAWGMRLVTDPKIRQLFRRLLLARRKKQKVLVFSQFSDTIAYLQSVLDATETFLPSHWQDALRAFDLPDLNPQEISDLCEATKTVTGQTESRDDVINSFAPFYRIGPWPPPSDSSSEDGSSLRAAWESSWSRALSSRVDILLSSDVLAEGVNLQDVALLINYDIHWNPVRMIQRAGRIDRRLNPRIERTRDFPDLIHLADSLRLPRPRYYWHDHPDEAPVTASMILPDELEDALQLRERIASKTMAIDFTLGLEQGTGAEADWMRHYKYSGIKSLHDLQKDRSIEQLASHHSRLARHFASIGLQTSWADSLNGWFRETSAHLGSPLLARAILSRPSGTPERFHRYLEPLLLDGVLYWLWAENKPGSSPFDGWLLLDGQTRPSDHLRQDLPISPTAAGPLSHEILLAALERLHFVSLEEWSKSNKSVGRLLLQGCSAFAAPKFGTERHQIRISNFFLLQLCSFLSTPSPSGASRA